ncbi:conserved hypothetical protein [Methylocella tundrae]|uniref:Uncharacterized protein n=1 Tax=Methylocella tundrae TaxID=227605 RepID=A0A8B6M315_METTU|nr:hypothetical protein [Methylocella tundrae]VTZ25923.1 conserved hypothetical protein [Methylocella tundrae]VTZ48640.1 conserved hypothetical protein [Methylocella tundrae]
MDDSDDKAAPRSGELSAGHAGASQDIAAEHHASADQRDAESERDAAAADAEPRRLGRPSGAETSGSDSRQAHGAHLSAYDAGLSDLTPFFPREANGAWEAPPRGRFASFIDFGSNAAFVLCVLGFAFAAGTYFFGGAPGSGGKPATEAALPDSADLARKTQQMVEEISALKANVEALRVQVAQEQGGKEQRGIEKSVDSLKTRLDAVKTETSGALAELSTKVDRLQQNPALKQVAERLDRIEKQTALPTGSVVPMVKAATQNRNPAVQAKAQPADVPPSPKRLALITDWVVRDVYDGVALVENARGSIEVALGDQIPGAGTVKAIERRGGGWIVITSRGLVDYDHSIMVP